MAVDTPQTTVPPQQAISRKMSAAFEKVSNALAETEVAVVVCHVHPDADAVGSASAMVMALRQRGIRAVWTYGETDAPSKSLLTIPGWDAFVPMDELPEDIRIDTWIAVDCASTQRLGALADRMVSADRLVVIDHHDSNENFGDINMVDAEAESTTMLLLDFFEVWGVKLTPDMAHALYAGLLTDTVRFQFGRPRMHLAAAKLLGRGPDPRLIGEQLTGGHPFEFLPFVGAVFSTAEFAPEWGGGAGLVHVTVSNETMKSVGHDEVEAVVNIVRTTTSGDVTVVLKEYEPNYWTLSLRSTKDIDVSQVAGFLGGGGHIRAAGCSVEGTREDVLAALQSASETAIASRR